MDTIRLLTKAHWAGNCIKILRTLQEQKSPHYPLTLEKLYIGS